MARWTPALARYIVQQIEQPWHRQICLTVNKFFNLDLPLILSYTSWLWKGDPNTG